MKFFIYMILLTSTIYASVAQISSLKGHCVVEREGSEINAKVGLKLEEKDFIKTYKNAKVQIIFNDETIITVGRLSTFSIEDYIYDESNLKKSKVNFSFLKGSFKSVTGAIGKIAPDKFKVRTKTATIGIRGTTIVGNQRRVACTYGRISITSHGVTVMVPAGMYSETPPNASPSSPAPYTPGDIGSDDVEADGLADDTSDEVTDTQDDGEDPGEATDTQDDGQDSDEGINGSSDDTSGGDGSGFDEETFDDSDYSDSTETLNQVESDLDDDIRVSDEEKLDGDSSGDLDVQSLSDIQSPAIVSNLDTTEIDTTDLTKESIYGDDYLDYGYWKDEDIRVAVYGCGVITSSDYVDQMIQNGGTASYSGHLSSIVTKMDDIKVSSSGDVNIDFDFSHQTFDGNINVTEGGFKADISGDVHRYGFDSTSVTKASGSTANITDGSLNGKFYGDQAQDAGGKFNLNSDNKGSVQGVFWMQKQPE